MLSRSWDIFVTQLSKCIFYSHSWSFWVLVLTPDIPPATFSPCIQLNLLQSVSSNISHPKLRANFPASALFPYQTPWSSLQQSCPLLGFVTLFALIPTSVQSHRLLLSLAYTNTHTKVCFGRWFALLLKPKLQLQCLNWLTQAKMASDTYTVLKLIHDLAKDLPSYPISITIQCLWVLPSVRGNQDSSNISSRCPHSQDTFEVRGTLLCPGGSSFYFHHGNKILTCCCCGNYLCICYNRRTLFKYEPSLNLLGFIVSTLDTAIFKFIEA